MWYFLAVVLLLLCAGFLLVQLRLRGEISPHRRLLSVQLARTGPVLDFAAARGELHLFGLPIKRFRLESRSAVSREAAPRPAAEKVESAPASRPRRRRPLRAMMELLPQLARPVRRWLAGLWRATRVEQLEAEIVAGFAEPHLTGQCYGFYQAAVATLPAAAGRIRFIPDWSGTSFRGSARIALAVPVRVLVWRTLVLLWQVPLKKIIKLAIGTKEVQDGQ